MRYFFIYSMLLFIASSLSGQIPLELPNSHFNKQRRNALMDPNRSSKPISPSFKVRTMAEWEEVQAVLITWQSYPTILSEIVRHAVNECDVYIVTTDSIPVVNRLSFENIPLDRVHFIDTPNNSVWIRDYGPWSAYKEDVDSLVIVDWIYNRIRPDDDTVSRAVARQFSLPIFETISPPNELVHTGGNYLVDGYATAFSSELILAENPDKSEVAIDNILKTFGGIEQYHKLSILPYDAIHHMDMHMRFMDEETLLIGEYPEGVADGPFIEANIQRITSQMRTSFGNPFKIIRIQMPPDQMGRYPDNNGFYRTYTNSIFINKTILVPIYEPQYDSTALALYEEEFPGYNIVGIDCDEIIPALGALHCITKLIGIEDPLWIAHPKLRDTYNNELPYPVEAIIKHKTGIQEATLYYRKQSESIYNPASMVRDVSNPNRWISAIPAQEAGSRIEYYIQARANSGKEQVRPLVAPEGYFHFDVLELTSAPDPIFEVSDTTPCSGEGVHFSNFSAIPVDSFYWQFPGGTPSFSNASAPTVIYDSPGNYDVSLTVFNSIGSNSLTRSNLISIEEAQSPRFEPFETFPASSIWEIINPDEDETTWAIQNGFCRGQAIALDNFNEMIEGRSDQLAAQVNLFDINEATFSFDVAYAPFNSNFFDELLVKITTCDNRMDTVYYKSGFELGTAPASTLPFVPSSCEEWRRENIDLSNYIGSEINITFENIGGHGNILYLDNIDIQSPQLPNFGPQVNLITPLNGTIYQDELPVIDIEAEATDSDGIIQEVSFWVNEDSIGLDADPPFKTSYAVEDFDLYQFQAKAIDNDGAIALSEKISITVETILTSTDTLPYSIEAINIFPTPAQNYLELSIQVNENFTLSGTLSNYLGQVLKKVNWPFSPGEYRQIIPLSDYPSGNYQLTIRHAEWIRTYKIVIVK